MIQIADGGNERLAHNHAAVDPAALPVAEHVIQIALRRRAGQRFEAADGSTIVFDSDFYGNHRGARVLPGPFATLDASMQPLF